MTHQESCFIEAHNHIENVDHEFEMIKQALGKAGVKNITNIISEPGKHSFTIPQRLKQKQIDPLELLGYGVAEKYEIEVSRPNEIWTDVPTILTPKHKIWKPTHVICTKNNWQK